MFLHYTYPPLFIGSGMKLVPINNPIGISEYLCRFTEIHVMLADVEVVFVGIEIENPLFRVSHIPHIVLSEESL